MMRRIFSFALFLALALPVYGQAVQGAHGERTEVIWDQGKPLIIQHLDSLGNTLSLKAYAYEEGSAHPSHVTAFKDPDHWERKSYTYAGNRVLTMAVYGPFGRKDTLSWKEADTTGSVRWKPMPEAPDPLAEWQGALEASRLCGLDALLSPDPLDGKAFLFGADGRFLSCVQSGYEEGPLILWQGEGREPIVARFSDPGYDDSQMGPDKRVHLVSTEEIAQAMDICGASTAPSKGFFPGCIFLLKNSAYGVVLDFANRPEYGVSSDTYYVADTQKEGTVAYNHYNYGNFLWGASAREVKVPLWTALLGAHVHNFFLSPYSRFQPDSPDDQFSIRAGYHWR